MVTTDEILKITPVKLADNLLAMAGLLNQYCLMFSRQLAKLDIRRSEKCRELSKWARTLAKMVSKSIDDDNKLIINWVEEQYKDVVSDFEDAAGEPFNA